MNIEPQLIDGIKCYAAESAMSNKNYNKLFFKRLFDLEERNFWFQSRNVVLQTLVDKYFGDEKDGKFLEIGCGTGYVLKGLEKFKKLELIGAEIYLEGLIFAKERLPGTEFVQLDAARLPFNNEFDCIGAFDVLEHIEKDDEVMKSVYVSLKKNGLFFISVPQYMFMWSNSDVIAYHKRRYSKSELRTKLNNAGFKIEFDSSFVFVLFPLMYVSRLLRKNTTVKNDEDDLSLNELRVNPFINFILRSLMRIDEFLIKLGVKLPFGGSLIVVARKY
jgi:SAM-dependent methyltransferase